MTIVVTGANGFIGGAIVRRLISQGIFPILVDENDNRCSPACPFIHKDKFLDEVRNYNIDTIIHQGACSDTTNHDVDFMMQNNYLYSQKILSACDEMNIRLIYASSAAVYGLGNHGFTEDISFDSPLNVYARSKLAFDVHVNNHSKKNQVVGLRYFNVYGFDESHKGHMASTIFQFYKQAQGDNKVRPFEGSENFYRDFIYVEDIVDVNMFFLDHPEISGIFNAGTGVARSFLDIAKVIQRKTQCSISSRDFPKHLVGKYQAFTQADTSKLRSVGYKKTPRDLESGIYDYIKKLS